MARPKANIDAKQVRTLASFNFSYEELAAFFECDPSTLTRRFAQDIQHGRCHMRMSLKRKQFEMAMDGNVQLLIWLGKQYLGQTDKIENTDSVTIQAPTITESTTIDLIKQALNGNKE